MFPAAFVGTRNQSLTLGRGSPAGVRRGKWTETLGEGKSFPLGAGSPWWGACHGRRSLACHMRSLGSTQPATCVWEQRPWVELVKALQVILVISQVGASEAWRVDVTGYAPSWPPPPCWGSSDIPRPRFCPPFFLLTQNKQKEGLTSRSNI